MKRISQRQLLFFLACVAPVGKLVVMPARLSALSGGDLWIPALAHTLLQSAAVFCALLVAKKGLTLGELLENTFGKALSKIFLCILALFLFYAAFLPLLEQKIFVQGVFYDTLPSLVAFAPFFVFSAYLCAKPLGDCGRVWDILGPVSAASLIGIVAFSAANADYAAVLPVGASGLGKIAEGAAHTFGWYFDSILVLLLAGRIDYRRGTAWKGALAYLAGGIFVAFFLVMFYGIYEGTAPNQLFAFTKTSKYFSAITALGRIDYVFIFALALVMSFYCAMPLQAGVGCVAQAFGKENGALPVLVSVAVNALCFAGSVLFDYRFGNVMDVMFGKLFYLFPAFALLLPPLCLLLRRSHDRA